MSHVWMPHTNNTMRFLRTPLTILSLILVGPRIAYGQVRAPVPAVVHQPWRRLDSRVGVVPNSVVFSPNGRTLVASGDAEELNGYATDIWDTHTWRIVRTLHGEGGANRFSPDGHLLITEGDWKEEEPPQKTLTVWNTQTWRKVHTFPGVGTSVANSAALQLDVAFSPDGKLLALNRYIVAKKQNAVRLWDVATGRLRSKLEGHQEPVYAVALSPDGRLIAAGGKDGLFIWRAPTTDHAKRGR